jgi:hypothetical protein
MGVRGSVSARTAAEAAFVEHKGARDWETRREALEERLKAENTAPPPRTRAEFNELNQTYLDSHYVRLDAYADHETAKAVHFDGCASKDSS